MWLLMILLLIPISFFLLALFFITKKNDDRLVYSETNRDRSIGCFFLGIVSLYALFFCFSHVGQKEGITSSLRQRLQEPVVSEISLLHYKVIKKYQEGQNHYFDLKDLISEKIVLKKVLVEEELFNRVAEGEYFLEINIWLIAKKL